MEFIFADFLDTYRSKIIKEWVEKLHSECGEQYTKRPVEELKGNITQAVDANFQVLVHENYDAINVFIDRITGMRLKTGFLLSDVQKAFELYRIIVSRFLIFNISPKQFHKAVGRLNSCLAYTIHRFSDHFQDMHQKKILQQNRELEQKVKQRTVALEESERKYKTLVEEINDGYFVIQNEVIVFANQAFCSMHGYEKLDDVKGRKFGSFVAPSSRKQVLGIYSDISDQKTTQQVFEYKRLMYSKKEFPTEIHGKTTRYDNKISSIGICRDITERVAMEKKARENERMVYIGYITASLSHEIRNPLSAVKLNLQILKKNHEIKGNNKRRVNISVAEVIRLEKILNQLLDFAKPLTLNLEYHDIAQILYSYIELLDIKFKEKNLLVDTEFDNSISKLLVDSDKLGQAFINLLLNAIESSDPFGEIFIKYQPCSNDDKFVQVTISDRGVGFPLKNSKDIFKPFFTTKTKGVGLGLANVKRIIEAHKGFVSVKKRETKGSSFSMMIPVRST